MTGYSDRLKGAFAHATTPTGQKIIIPHWTADHGAAQKQITEHGIDFSPPSGIVFGDSVRPVPVRVIFNADTYRSDVQGLEKPGVADFVSSSRRVQLIPADPKEARIAIMDAHIRPTALESVAGDPRILGIRPHGDPYFPTFMQGWREAFAATPAPGVA